METSDSLKRWTMGLPDDTVKHRFVSVADFSDIVEVHVRNLPHNINHSPFLAFLDVPEDAFQEIVSSELPAMNQCRLSYSHWINCLIIETLTEIHKLARAEFISLFDRKLSEMEVYDELRRDGDFARTYGNKTRQPDAQWVPLGSLEVPVKPTILLEVGVWESQKRIELAGKKWLASRDSPVMLVLVVKVYDCPKIIIQLQQGTRTSQFSSAGKSMEVICTRPNDTTFVDNHLTLPFEKIFWRMTNCERNPKEMDIIFTRQDMTMIVESIWKAQGLI